MANQTTGSIHCSTLVNLKFNKLQLSKLFFPIHSPLFLVFLVLILSPAFSHAASCDQWVAKAVSVEGQVESRLVGETQWRQISLDDTFCAGDMIRVLENSRAGLAFANQPLVRLDQNTSITLGEIKTEGEGLAGVLAGAASLDFIKGAAHFFSRLPKNLEVRTGFVNAGVEGTEFLVEVEDTRTTITVFEGKVLASNSAGEVGITDGQSAVAEKGKAPVMRTVVSPRDAVRWALYYPPVIFGTDPDASMNQAAQLLAVGRVDEAAALIQQGPQNSSALSLQSIIAVVQNNAQQAVELADQAVTADPESATARIAQSYARQASFDLEGARESLEKAVELEPDNALALARLAEIHSSFGMLTRAVETAEQAVAIAPNLSRTQTVLGFAYLTQIRTSEARDAFNRAIELDQADSLPRLGLGLATIRDGELADGRQQIEIAASLDPNSSIIRSYLGKAYFEEKRADLDGREYAIAKELDPNDPTPWFYDAIRKQTINRPVEALYDLEKANELNDNRAVYRSKLLLDSDLAARSASLARIYTDLGFRQRALVEGYNSVNLDPTNHSAHRFLADTYSVLPRHEIARVSELLQSQLLQPNNITPIQPRLAESNLSLISAGGPASASFNEFNPLFNRDRVALQASGIVAEQETYGGEAILSGIYQKLSYSVGYSHSETDGWRENNDRDTDLANIFLQGELSYKTSIQGEYRYKDNERGDLIIRFDPENFRPNERYEGNADSYRLGFRHNFNPNSIVIGNFQYQNLESLVIDQDPGIFKLDIDSEVDGGGGEVQYLYRRNTYNVIAGAGYFDVDDANIINFSLFGIPDPEVEFSADTEHTNLYAYSNITLPYDITATIGASGDFFKSEGTNNEDTDQFNPKLGLIWKPTPNTTVRGAALRTIKRTLITDQTLEPTQVAGFNQFYDDINATSTWRYGAGVDQKFSRDVYGGIEISKRDLEVPYFSIVENAVAEEDWEEYLGRAYLFWAPHNWVSLSAEYIYEKYERDENFSAGVLELESHKVPLGANFFHPSGVGASAVATYYNQDGEFQDISQNTFFPGEDDFWVVDLILKYRLPKRFGIIELGAYNLFDEEFNYFNIDFVNPSISPERLIFGRVTLSF